jgi:hypothetical protein
MFLSVIRPTARIAAVAPRIVGSQIGSVRFFALGDELKKKVRQCLVLGDLVFKMLQLLYTNMELQMLSPMTG